MLLLFSLRCLRRPTLRAAVSNAALTTTVPFVRKMLPTKSLVARVKTCSSIGAKATATPCSWTSVTIRPRPPQRQHRLPVLVAVCRWQKASLRARNGLHRSRHAMRSRIRITILPRARAAMRFQRSAQRAATTSVHQWMSSVRRTIQTCAQNAVPVSA